MDSYDLLLNPKEHKFYKKYKRYLEKRYSVQIFIPNVVNSSSIADIIFGTIRGSKCNVEDAKKFISKKVSLPMKNNENMKPNNVEVITLSDSEESSGFDSEGSAGKLDSSNSAVDVKEASFGSKLGNDSVCIIENTDDTNKIAFNGTNSVITLPLLSDSICIIESPADSKLSPNGEDDGEPVVSSASLDSSILIMDCPYQSENYPVTTSKISKSKRFKSKRNKKCKEKDFDKVSQLPQSSGAEDSDICEVSSTTEEPVLKRSKFSDESRTSDELPVKSSEPAPNFIALFEGSNSSLRASSAKDTSSFSVQKKEKDANDDIIVLDNSAPANHSQIPDNVLPRRLRPIVIDGSNVARAHGAVTETFSSKGIKICIDYFLERGHTDVVAFVPHFRKYGDRRKKFPTTDQDILEELGKSGKVIFTPSRKVQGQCFASYDDRFVVELASKMGGVIVSNDNFKDLIDVNEKFKEAIEKRLLMYCFVKDIFMVPDDPLGRNGPTLNEFLSFPAEEKP